MNAQPSPIRILLADDHPVLRQGIQALAADESDIQFVAEASTGREAIEAFRKHRPDVSLMDLQMPDMNGIDAIVAIRSEFPDRASSSSRRIRRCSDFTSSKGWGSRDLLKSSLRKDLLNTIRAVHAGHKRIPANLASEVADHIADDLLTAREIEVLKLIASGNANKLVADQLSITEETVKGHVKNILSKLGANDRTHAVTIGLKRGIIEL